MFCNRLNKAASMVTWSGLSGISGPAQFQICPLGQLTYCLWSQVNQMDGLAHWSAYGTVGRLNYLCTYIHGHWPVRLCVRTSWSVCKIACNLVNEGSIPVGALEIQSQLN